MDSVTEVLTEPKKPLTREEHKRMMRVYWTQHYDKVEQCGHSFHPTDQPRANCPWCWFAFFQIHGEVTKTADEVFTKEGRAMLVKIKGEKFTKNFLRFMTTLAHMKENNVNGFGTDGGSINASTSAPNEQGEVESDSGDRETTKQAV